MAAKERGEERENREDDWRESKNKAGRDKVRERWRASEGEREEMCRRTSLGSGTGLFNE